MRLDSRRQDGVFVRMTRVTLLSLALLQLTLAAIPHAHAIEPSSDAPRGPLRSWAARLPLIETPYARAAGISSSICASRGPCAARMRDDNDAICNALFL